jgi:hypothetical protein
MPPIACLSSRAGLGIVAVSDDGERLPGASMGK